MRNFKIALLLTAAIIIGAPPVLAKTPVKEKQRYEAFFTREMSDGFVLYSEKKHMRVSRQRRGDEAVTMYDELNGAAGFQSPQDSQGVELIEPEDVTIDYAYRYDYSDKRLYGPEDFSAYFNAYVRPFVLQHGTGNRGTARFTVSLAQMGLPLLKGQAAQVEASKQYVSFEGRRFALISFNIPAFSYTAFNGERIVHWASGAAITDETGGVTFYLAVRHRAAASAGSATARPMYAEQSSYATDENGRALLDLRRFTAGKALIDTALKGETGLPTYHLNVPSDADADKVLAPSFFAATKGLTAIALSVAEGSPNNPGATAAAGNGGVQATANAVNQSRALPGPGEPGARGPVPAPAPRPAPTRALPGPGEPGARGPVPAPAPRPAPTRALPGPGEPGTRAPLPAPVPRPTPTRYLPGPRPPGPLEPGYRPPPPPSPPLIVNQPPNAPTGRLPPLPAEVAAQLSPQAPRPSGGLLSGIKNAAGTLISKIPAPIKTIGRIGGRVGTGFNVVGAAGEVRDGLNFDPSKVTADDYRRMEDHYITNGAWNAGLTLFNVGTSGFDPVNALATLARVPTRAIDDTMQSYLGMTDAQRQADAANQSLLVTQERRRQQILDQIKGGIKGLKDDLARTDKKMAELKQAIVKGRQTALERSDELRAEMRRQRNQAQGSDAREDAREEAVDLPNPEIPGPGYPQLTKAQRDAIAKRAKDKKAQKQAQQDFDAIGDLGEAFDGTATGDLIGADETEYDWGDLEGDEITSESLTVQLSEQELAAEAARLKNKAAWQKMKDNHPDLTDIFGDFIDNNMFDFGGLDGKGLSGTVATDLSPYAEWLLEQDINRLNALARAAGYPNLASALKDSRNLIAKARDTGFRQWAWAPPAMSGAIGLWASEAQHELARAQVILGDLLNDSRFIESTAGLTDLAISGTTLSTIFRDFGLEDGDIIDITIQQLGQMLFKQRLTLTNAGTAIQTNLRRGVGRVEIFAVNEGFASPNTAEISVSNVTAGDQVQQYQLRTGEIAILRVQTGR